VSYWKCSPEDHAKYSITPIGRPIRNTYFYVVDENLRLLPDGEKGELLIGGIGVAQGYYKQSSLTKEKFVVDPFYPDLGRVYRSGDLVLKDRYGDFEFFGRIDFQIKINGQRVEPGEIENSLLKIESIKRAAVIYEKNILYAFIENSSQIEENSIVELLKRQLPIYMIPSKYLFLSEMPLNSSGKIDRTSLKQLI